jgi:membrane associated rhomboid family serine protease
MFVHDSVFGLIGTTLWLWAFGYILQDLAGNNRLFPVYLYGGVVGGIFFLAAVHIFPGSRANLNAVAPFLSGSASVIAIAIAVTSLAPRYRLLPMINGGVPLWVLTVIFVIVDFVSVVRTNGPFAFAHMGAGLTGFFFIDELRRGRDWGGWMTSFVGWVDDLFNPAKKHAKQKEKQKLFYKATKKPF